MAKSRNDEFVPRLEDPVERAWIKAAVELAELLELPKAHPGRWCAIAEFATEGAAYATAATWRNNETSAGYEFRTAAALNAKRQLVSRVYCQLKPTAAAAQDTELPDTELPDTESTETAAPPTAPAMSITPTPPTTPPAAAPKSEVPPAEAQPEPRKAPATEPVPPPTVLSAVPTAKPTKAADRVNLDAAARSLHQALYLLPWYYGSELMVGNDPPRIILNVRHLAAVGSEFAVGYAWEGYPVVVRQRTT